MWVVHQVMEMKVMEISRLAAALVLCLALLVGLLLGLLIPIGAGRSYAVSTPITSLEQGRVYEVKAMAVDTTNCFLLLKSEENIRFYQLPFNRVPVNLAPGDSLVELSTGLVKLPG